MTYFTRNNLLSLGGYNLGGINASGQVPTMAGTGALIDVDTPSSALTSTSYGDGSEWQLIFSDEFNMDGHTFYPGDDPFWEAVNLHYWAVRFECHILSQTSAVDITFRLIIWSGTTLWRSIINYSPCFNLNSTVAVLV